MNKIDLDQRVAIVTGGARGIGYATAERMLRSGARVVLWDRDESVSKHAAETLLAGQKSFAEKGKLSSLFSSAFSGQSQSIVSVVTLDLTDADAVQKATEKVVKEQGKIDILVNNAGISGGNAKLWELSPTVWRQVIEVNLIAPFLVCHAVVPEMLKTGYGRIVNVASIAGKEGNPNASHYSSSKAGLIGLTKSLGKELATSNILVNCITPAAAKTEIFDQMTPEFIAYMLSKIPMDRFVETREIAAMIAWLASEECSFSTGSVFDISGGRAVY